MNSKKLVPMVDPQYIENSCINRIPKTSRYIPKLYFQENNDKFKNLCEKYMVPLQI